MQPKMCFLNMKLKKDLKRGRLTLYKIGFSNVSRIWFLFMVAYTKHASGCICSWSGGDPSVVCRASGTWSPLCPCPP